MGLELANRYPAARAVFDRADEALGFALSQLCFEGPAEELKRTENTQPAILTTSIATLAVLREMGAEPNFVAGHSLGEYSALVAAGSIAFEDAVQLVRKRGRCMPSSWSGSAGGACRRRYRKALEPWRLCSASTPAKPNRCAWMRPKVR
jgi:[acyl-carrier-protein] S-malonyltransferase